MEKGDKIWVEQDGGEQRAAVFAGQSEEQFGGGMPRAAVVYESGEGELVDMMRVIPREDGASEQA
jgi:hypothetical protein